MKYELIFSNGEEIFEKADVEQMNEKMFTKLVDVFFNKIFKDEELFCPEDKELYYQQVKDNCSWGRYEKNNNCICNTIHNSYLY